MQTKFKLIGSSLAAVLLAGTSNVAFAQDGTKTADSGDRFGDIIVTATRREERLQKVPIAVSAFTPDTLAQQGITKAEDLVKVTPGLQMSRFVGDPGATSFGIRGHRTQDNRPHQDAAVVVYIAEVPQKLSFGIGISGFLDLKSIEVLRGPQGTLFGRNSTGGAVLLVPNTPTDKLEGSAKITYGNYNRINGEAVLNLPLGDGIGLRVAGLAGHRDGWYRNNFPGGETLASENFTAARASFQVKRDALTTTFYGDIVEFHGSGISAKPVGIKPTGLANVLSGGLLLATEQANKTGYFWSTTSKRPARTKSRVWGVSNTTTYEINDALTFKNIIGYRYVFAYQAQDTDGTAYDALQSSIPDEDKQFSEEAQLQYASGPLKLIGGAFYFREKGEDGMPGRGFPLPISFGGLFPTNMPDNTFRNRAASVYAEGTYDLTSQLHLTLGGRYTWDQRNAQSRTKSDPGGGLPIFCAIVDDATGLHPPLDKCLTTANANFSKFTYNATLQYEIDGLNQVYASYRRGYRTGGFVNDPATVKLLQTPYNPETVDSYEAGYKGQIDLGAAALRLNMAGYYSKYTNIQKADNRTFAGQLRTVTVNAAKATIYGLEVESGLNIGDNVSLSGTYTFTHAKYDSFVITSGDFTNRPFGFLPKHKLSGSARFSYPLGEGSEIAFQPSISWQSETWLDDQAEPSLYQPAYSTVSARLEWKANDRLKVSAWGQNLFNTKYYLSGVGVQTLGLSIIYPAEPRTYGLELSTKF